MTLRNCQQLCKTQQHSLCTPTSHPLANTPQFANSVKWGHLISQSVSQSDILKAPLSMRISGPEVLRFAPTCRYQDGQQGFCYKPEETDALGGPCLRKMCGPLYMWSLTIIGRLYLSGITNIIWVLGNYLALVRELYGKLCNSRADTTKDMFVALRLDYVLWNVNSVLGSTSEMIGRVYVSFERNENIWLHLLWLWHPNSNFGTWNAMAIFMIWSC